MTARVLVVDDLEPNILLLEQLLLNEYFEVLSARSGAEALITAEREQPDLILLDVMMPELDGFETCRRLRANPQTSHIPIAMVTALGDTADRVRGLEAGADDFLVKPIRDVELYARVRSLIRLKTIVDELRARQATDLMVGASGDHGPVAARPAKLGIVDCGTGIFLPFRETLESLGRVDVLHPDSAVTDCERLNCDLILLHLASDRADGLRLVARIRSNKNTRRIPILAVTSPGDTRPLVKGFELGVSDCVDAQADPLELKARARTILKRKYLTDRMRENVHLSMQLATTDAVTGLFNRHYMTRHLETLAGRVHREQKPLSVAMVDVDHFKTVNDTHGHAAGDRVLREIAQRISLNVRGVDLAARFGGEEFVILMPETDLDDARQIAERIRGTVEDQPFTIVDGGVESMRLTISVGVSTLGPQDEPEDVLRRADEALYAAKGSGRNKVIARQSRPRTRASEQAVSVAEACPLGRP